MPQIRVRAIGTDGIAVPGAHLSVPWASVPFPEVAYLAGDDGAATLNLRTGEYRLRADAPDGRSGEASVAVADMPAGVDIRVEEA